MARHGRLDMTTRNITLTAKQEALVDQMVRSGAYQTASEAIGKRCWVCNNGLRQTSCGGTC